MADIHVGTEWAVSSASILRAVRDRMSDPGLRERHGLGEALFPFFESLVNRVNADDLTRQIVDDCGKPSLVPQYDAVKVTVRGTGEPYRARMDGVRIEATAQGIPVELWVHRSALLGEWPVWELRNEIGRAELRERLDQRRPQ